MPFNAWKYKERNKNVFSMISQGEHITHLHTSDIVSLETDITDT